MRAATAIVLLSIVSDAFAGSSFRGVGSMRADKYGPGGVVCDNGTTVPVEKINDDYCDCFDGMDEPGTAACPNGIMECRNLGYKAAAIPASHVDDGVCDCCDGSDEEYGLCRDMCLEKSAEQREELLKRAEALKSGIEEQKKRLEVHKLDREELGRRAERLRGKAELKRGEVAQLEVDKRQKEAEEQKERRMLEQQGKQAPGVDSGIGAPEAEGGLDEEEGEGEEEEEDDEGDFDQEADEDDYEFMDDEEGDFDEYDDEEEDEEGIMDDEDIDEDDVIDEDDDEFLDYDLPEGEGDGLPDEHSESEGGEPEGAMPGVDEEFMRKYQKPPDWDDEEDGEWHPPNATAEAEEARQKHREAEEALKKLEADINAAQEQIDRDYGPGDVFSILDSLCFEQETAEYTYKVCPYGRAKQGGVDLGKYEGFEEGYRVMVFSGGQACPGGHSRSTRISLECADRDELVGMDEPEMCRYAGRLLTPAGCWQEDLNATWEELDEVIRQRSLRLGAATASPPSPSDGEGQSPYHDEL